MTAYKYQRAPGSAGAQHAAGAALSRLIEDVLPALREQADRTVDELAAARERSDARTATRLAARAELRARREKGLR